MMIRFCTVLIALACVLMPAPAHAWGPLGHRLVARLADTGLTPDTRRQIERLLADEPEPSLAGIANWADTLREQDPDLGRRSAAWHYLNFDDGHCRYDASVQCRNGDCVVDAIQAQAAILADRSRPGHERLQALKFVVHFVGDIHQPLHAGLARDRGGNTVQIQFEGRGSNLHRLWDSGLLGTRQLRESDYLAHLLALRAQASQAVVHVQAADAASWAGESCAIVAAPGFYPAKANVPASYVQHYLPVADQALLRAGARLAAVLNDALAQG
jgi:hypothetical protein